MKKPTEHRLDPGSWRETLCAGAIDVPHLQREVGMPRLPNEVALVAHQTPGQRASVKPLQPRSQQIKQRPSVHIVHKDRLTTVPASSGGTSGDF